MEVRAAYEVIVSARDPELSDEVLQSMFEDARSRILGTLERRARARLGPAYTVGVGPTQPHASIRTMVIVAVVYPVKAGAAFVERARAFAGDIEVAIAEALAEVSGRAPLEVLATLDSDSLSEAEPDSGEKEKASWESIAPVLAAIATGLGVLGFVTFVGGAILWARFHAAGLPKEAALSVVPTTDLVVIGAHTLVPAVVFGLLATAIYGLTVILFGRRDQRIPDPQRRAAVEERHETGRAIGLLVFVVGFEICAFSLNLDDPTLLQFAGFLGLGLLAAALTFGVAILTERFVYLALTVFLALSVLVAGIAYLRAWTTPELRGAAIVRNNKKAIIGFYVAENGSRVYLARLRTAPLAEGRIDRSSSRLIGVQKDQITDVEIGPSAAPADALAQARSLAAELCSLEPTAAPAPAEDTKEKDADGKATEGKTKSEPTPPQICWTKPAGE